MMYEELVKQCRGCLDSLCGECKYEHLQKAGNFVPCMNALLGEAADAIEKLTDMNVGKWIPVTERLPKKDVPVFVYLFGDIPYIAWINREGEWETEQFTIDHDYLPKVWMPLPEPPKEET